jgi:pimeloyl-ACP methyl ester carboxylesterase
MTRMKRILLAVLIAVVAILPVTAPLRPCAVVFVSCPAHAAAPGQDDELPRKGFFGVRLAPLSDEVRAREHLGKGAGILIEAVIPGTTAADGDLREGDVLLAVDGSGITNVGDVMTIVAAMRVRQQFEVTLLRTGRRIVVPMTLRERPRDRGQNFDVMYEHVVSGAARIRTIVTRPHTPGRHPVLFLIQGQGPVTIDQPLSGPEPYSSILDEFAKSGYVTVRVEKPGVGDSEGGPFAEVDFEAELDAYRQAMTHVRKYAFVDVDNIFMFGHSMGGVFSPIIASETPIRGIAVYGTVAKTWMEYFLENWRRQAVLAGDDPARIDSLLRNLAVALHYLLMEQKVPDEILRLRPELRSTLAKLAPAGRIDSRSVRFWSQLVTKNLPAYWAKGNAYVLAIWGRNDFIATEADHPFIAEIVNKARPGKGVCVALDGTDHGFRKTVSIEDSFTRWKAPGGEFNPRIITILKEWMDKVRQGQ